jgi:tetratricopeptide (TPR) repeat protein
VQYPRLGLIATMCLITACGSDDDVVVAEVHTYLITAPAIRTWVEQLPSHLHAATDSNARRQYLQLLIDRRLLLLEARGRGLDSSRTLSEDGLLEALENTLGNPSFSEAEIRRFYRNRPELFYDKAARIVHPYEEARAQAHSLLLRRRREADLQQLLVPVRRKYHRQIRIYPEDLERALSDSLLRTRNQRRGAQLNQRGSALLQQDRPHRALTSLKQATTYDPASHEAHFNLGLAHSHLNQYDQALVAFERAVDLNPHSADYHYALGTALQTQHRYTEAATHLHRAIELAPDQPRYHFHLGEARRSLVNLEEAKTAYAEALRLQPDYSEARYRHSDLLGRSGDLGEAAAGFERILAQEPRNVEAHIGLAWVHTKAGQHHRAVQSLQQATRLAPSNANAHYLLSQAYVQSDQEVRADSVVEVVPGIRTVC